MEVVPTCRSPAPRTCTAAESRARSAPLAITLGVARTAASRHYRAREPGPALGRDGHRRREASTAHRGTTLTMRRPRHDSGHRSRSATDLYSISTGSSEPSKIAPSSKTASFSFEDRVLLAVLQLAETGRYQVSRGPKNHVQTGAFRHAPDPPLRTYDIFEGTEQIQQLVISRAISGIHIQ